MPALQKMRLADDQDFANVVAGEEEFYGSEIAEKIFYVAIVKNPLQPELARRAAFFSVAASNVLHFQNVAAHDVVTVTGRVGARLLGVKKRQQHAARL
jgi:hypothetical protein